MAIFNDPNQQLTVYKEQLRRRYHLKRECACVEPPISDITFPEELSCLGQLGRS